MSNDNKKKAETSKSSIVIAVVLIFISISLWGTLIGLYFYREDSQTKTAIQESEEVLINTENLKTVEDETYFETTSMSDDEYELFLATLNTFIEMSEGTLIKIEPRLKDDDWRNVSIVVSDAWYYSEDFEKERFSESTSEMVKEVIKGFNLVPADKSILITFFDVNEKELASPKTFGGYDIKR